MKNKGLKIAAVSAVSLGIIGLAGAVGLNQVSAAEEGEYPPIIEKLADKLGLSEDELHNAFEEAREEMRDDRLDQLVADGDLTQEQRELLKSHHEEVKAKMDEIRNSSMTDEEKKEAMKELHEANREWAKENDIPKIGPMNGQGRGMKKARGFGMHQ